MAIGIFGRKLGMTQMFDEKGTLNSVTLVQAEPCQISQIKTTEKEGYNAIQLAYFEENIKRISKPLRGHLAKSGTAGFKKFGDYQLVTPASDDSGPSGMVVGVTTTQLRLCNCKSRSKRTKEMS